MRTLVFVPLLLVSSVGLRAQERDSSAFVSARASAPSDAAAKKRAAERRRRRIDYLPATTIDYNAARLVEKRATGWNVLTSGDRQTTYLIVRRTVSSEPEVHARWDDIVIVRSGAGAIEMGDSLVKSRLRAPGERAGGELTKKTQLVVRGGDVVRIPAAVPHAFIVSGSEPLEYLLIKQRRQELPIRWYGVK
jgi:mannose-6-phosphate isomerase-like protein (cupin superfamily)